MRYAQRRGRGLRGTSYRRGGRSRANRDIGEELLHLDDGDSAPRTSSAIAYDDDRLPPLRRRSGYRRIMIEQVGDRIVANANRLNNRVIQAPIHGVSHRVDRAAAERVVRLRLEQCTPCGDE